MTKENVFNLEEYFLNEYQYKFENFENLLSQPFIEYESAGANALFWIQMDNQKYLFKEIKTDEYTWLGELLSKEIADILGIPCAEYKVCKLKDKFGILSKKFTKKNETIILGAQILQEALDKYPYIKNESLLNDEEFLTLYNIPDSILKMERKFRVRYLYNNLNNLEQLWALSDIYLELNHSDKKYTETIMNYLVNTFLFDLITMQADRHIENWGIVKNQETNEIEAAHLFDNSACFGLWDPKLDQRMYNFYYTLNSYQMLNTEKTKKQFINTFYKDRMLLTASEDAIKNARARKRENNLEVLDYFLKASNEDYINLFEDYITKIKTISISSLLTKIEEEQKITISDNIKQYLIDAMNWNLYFLEEKVKLRQMQQGRGRNE